MGCKKPISCSWCSWVPDSGLLCQAVPLQTLMHPSPVKMVILQSCKNIYRGIYWTGFLVKVLLHLEQMKRAGKFNLTTRSMYFWMFLYILWMFSCAGFWSYGKSQWGWILRFERAEESFLPSVQHHFPMGLCHLYYRTFIIRDRFLMFKRSGKSSEEKANMS